LSRPYLLGETAHVLDFAGLLHEVAPDPRPNMTNAERHRHELEILRKAAHHQGYAAGYEEGLSAGREAGFAAAQERGLREYREVLDQFSQELAHIDDLVRHGMETWYARAEEEVESLVVSIARKVLHQELTLDRSSVLQIVRGALQEVTMAREARIRVNPLDAPTLATARADLIAASQGLRAIEIVEDPSILGGCSIETDGGRVEATFDGALHRLEEAA